jgi:chromosome segregation ATPase
VKFDQVADELYSLPRGQFTSMRNDRAAEARAGGRKELAAKIKKLPKPTTAASLANQVVRKHRSEVQRLAKIGDALRKAHQAVKGKALQELSRERHDLVRALMDKARAIAHDEDVSLSETAAAELEDNFAAAVADPAAAKKLLDGRLATALAGAGGSAEAWLLSAGTTAKRPAARRPREREDRRARTAGGTRDETRDGTRARAPGGTRDRTPGGTRDDSDTEFRRRELNRATQSLRAAERAVTGVGRDLVPAERRQDAAERKLEEARRGQEAAERRLEEARRGQEEAQRSADDLRARAAEAEQRAGAARELLTRLGQ